MIRIIVLIAYLSVGLGVVAFESERQPEIKADPNNFIFLVAVWPSFPANRLYKQWVGA